MREKADVVVIALMLAGIVSGGLSVAAALAADWPVALALCAYPLGGTIGTVMTAMLVLAGQTRGTDLARRG